MQFIPVYLPELTAVLGKKLKKQQQTPVLKVWVVSQTCTNMCFHNCQDIPWHEAGNHADGRLPTDSMLTS